MHGQRIQSYRAVRVCERFDREIPGLPLAVLVLLVLIELVGAVNVLLVVVAIVLVFWVAAFIATPLNRGD